MTARQVCRHGRSLAQGCDRCLGPDDWTVVTLLRVKSHRARDRLSRILGDELRPWVEPLGGGYFYSVPVEREAEALAVASVSRARWPERPLMRPLRMGDR